VVPLVGVSSVVLLPFAQVGFCRMPSPFTLCDGLLGALSPSFPYSFRSGAGFSFSRLNITFFSFPPPLSGDPAGPLVP